jgi:hypothetical protein
MQNIVNVGKGDFKMPDDGERERKVQKFLTRKYEPFVAFAKKVLFEKVNSVVVSGRLTAEPCVVVADTYGHSSFMDKIQKAQMFNSNADDNPVSDFKKILEINPHHRVVQIVLDRINVPPVPRRPTPPTPPLRNSSNSSTKLPPSTPASRPRTPTSSCAASTKSTRRPWASSASTGRKSAWATSSSPTRTSRATTWSSSASDPKTCVSSPPPRSDCLDYVIRDRHARHKGRGIGI